MSSVGRKLGLTLGCEPAVIEIEPADGGTDVERATDGVEDVGSPGNACA